jgi:hypothetical protein
MELSKFTENSIERIAKVLLSKGYKDTFFIGVVASGSPAEAIKKFLETRKNMEQVREMLWLKLETDILIRGRSKKAIAAFDLGLTKDNEFRINEITVWNKEKNRHLDMYSVPVGKMEDMPTRGQVIKIAEAMYAAISRKHSKRMSL